MKIKDKGKNTTANLGDQLWGVFVHASKPDRKNGGGAEG